jgi:hypothetical protein
MRLASIIAHPAAESQARWPGWRCRRVPGRAGWSLDPSSAPWRGLKAQDTRTVPLDVKRAYMPCITRFSHD